MPGLDDALVREHAHAVQGKAWPRGFGAVIGVGGRWTSRGDDAVVRAGLGVGALVEGKGRGRGGTPTLSVGEVSDTEAQWVLDPMALLSQRRGLGGACAAARQLCVPRFSGLSLNECSVHVVGHITKLVVRTVFDNQGGRPGRGSIQACRTHIHVNFIFLKQKRYLMALSAMAFDCFGGNLIHAERTRRRPLALLVYPHHADAC